MYIYCIAGNFGEGFMANCLKNAKFKICQL